MFLSDKTGKFVSVLVALVMLATCFGALPVTFAADDNDILNTDFSDYITPGGTTAPPGMQIFNSDAGKAQCLPVSDDIYGNVAMLSLTEDSLKYLAIGKYVTPDLSKSFVVETAIKRHEIAGSDFAVDLWSGGKQLIKFDKKGNIYFGDNTLVGAYEADVWYDVKIEYYAPSKLLKVRINGGRYENTVVSKTWEQIAFTEFDFGMRNVSEGLKADVYIGYCKVYETDPFEVHTNIQMSFDNFDEGALADSSLSADSNYYYFDSGFRCQAAHEGAFFVEEADERYGMSLAMDAVGGMNQFILPLKAPYTQKFEDGISYMDFSLRLGDNMLFYVIADGEGTDLISGKNGYFFPMYMGGNNSYLHVGSIDKEEDKLMFEWENNHWYDISFAFDMDSGIMTFTISDSQNPDVCARKTRSIEGFSSLTQLAAASGNNSGDTTSSYIDNIRVYEEAMPEVMSISPANGTVGASASSKITVKFNMPIDPLCVTRENISLEGGNITEDDYEIYTLRGNIVCIQPFVNLDTQTQYTVRISPLTDVFGNTMEADFVSEFVTSKFITVSTPVYTTDGSDKNMYAKVKFSDGEYRDLLVVYAIYDKQDGSLIDFNTFSANRAEMNANISVTAPSDREYYNEVMILDTYCGLKPYTSKFTDDMSAVAPSGDESVSLSTATQILTINGKADNAGEVVVAVLKPGYTQESLSGANKEEFYNALNYIRQIKTDEEGNFSTSYKINGASGTYTVVMNFEGSETDAVKISELEYFSPREIVEALSEINNCTDADEIASVLSDKCHILGFDMSVYNCLSDDGKKNSLKMFYDEKEGISGGNGFSDIAEATESFERCAVFAEFAEADDKEKLYDIIEEYCEVLGLSQTCVYNTYVKLSKSNKLDVCEKILSEKPQGKEETAAVFCDATFVTAVNNLANWNSLNSLICDNEEILTEMNIKKYMSLKDSSIADKIIVKHTYSDIDDFCDTVNDILDDLNKPASSGGSSGSGSGGSASASVIPAYPTVPDTKDEPEAPKGISFEDMAGYEWANEAVSYLADVGIINGRSDTEFAPSDLVTREEFAKILVNAFSEVDKNAYADFEDVDKDAWYAPYVATAYSQNIVNGMGNGIFGTGMNITRQDMCVMAWRAAKLGADTINDKSKAADYADSELIAEYALDAVRAMSGANYINGMGNNEFGPLLSATRAQAAQIVYRIIIGKEAK